MRSATILILCTLLQVGNENVPPRIPVMERQPAGQQPPATYSAPDTPVVTPPVASPTTTSNQLYFQRGILELPKRNHVTTYATERAVLKSLKTEQRDENGNILRDDEGNPIMISIKEGMNVVKGQLLGNFDDRELRGTLKINQAQLAVAVSERDKDIEKRFALLGAQVAYAEYQALEIASKNYERAVPAIELQKARLAYEQARANWELQVYTIDEVKTREVDVRESELERTQVQIELRQLVAQIDGMIVKIKAAEGEWLREGEPVLEIMQLDTMWVRVDIDARKYSISDIDKKAATIHVTLAGGKVETFQGIVFFCDPKIKAGNTFEAYVEVQNRKVDNYWLLQPGSGGVDIVIPL